MGCGAAYRAATSEEESQVKAHLYISDDPVAVSLHGWGLECLCGSIVSRPSVALLWDDSQMGQRINFGTARGICSRCFTAWSCLTADQERRYTYGLVDGAQVKEGQE